MSSFSTKSLKAFNSVRVSPGPSIPSWQPMKSRKYSLNLRPCLPFGRLHKALTPAHGRALVAKYSTHEARKHGAILELLNSVKTPAPKRFRDCAVLTWAIPQVAGAEGKRSAAVLPVAWYDITNWDNDGKVMSFAWG